MEEKQTCIVKTQMKSRHLNIIISRNLKKISVLDNSCQLHGAPENMDSIEEI